MAKVFVAVLYLAVILLIGFVSAKKVKTADGFAVAGKKIPFWTNVYSMASAQIGAGATMGVASLVYANGISGMSLGIGAAGGAILSGLIFAKKIREANVTTIPELMRQKLGAKIANIISALTLFQIFGILAAQVRSLGTILQLFIPSISLTVGCIIMSIIMLAYAVVGGMVAATKTDKLNITIMILSIMVFVPILALKKVGGIGEVVSRVDSNMLNPIAMGIPAMLSTMLYFGFTGMVNNENFLRICGAKNAKEARGATLMSAVVVYLPYMMFCGLIGLIGVLLMPNLASSDSIIPAMIDYITGDLTGAFLLAGLLAAVMGTAASVAMVTSVTFSRDVVNRLKPSMKDNEILLTQRISLVGFTILAIFVAIYGGSIVGIMEDLGAPCLAALVPLFFGIFFWKKMNPKGALVTIITAVAVTLTWWIIGSPYISHFLVGLACSTIAMIISCNITYKDGAEEDVRNI